MKKQEGEENQGRKYAAFEHSVFIFIFICERRVCKSCTLLEVEKNGRLHEKGIRRMVSSSCEFEERRRKESRSIFFMVGFSHRRNLYE